MVQTRFTLNGVICPTTNVVFSKLFISSILQVTFSLCTTNSVHVLYNSTFQA